MSDVPEPPPQMSRGSASRPISRPGCRIVSRSTRLASSRTLPGQSYAISAAAADARIAAALGIDEGAACLVIERRTWSADNPVTHVRLIYPGDSHRLVARFAPSSG